MKALLKKDYLVIKKNMKMFMLIIILFVIAGTFNDNDAFYVVFPMMLSSVLVMSLISYDERYHFDSYCAALPVSRKLAVSEKYILSGILVGGIFLLCLLGMGYRGVITGPKANTEILSMLIVAILPPSVLLPLIYKYGTEKARLYNYIVILVGVGISYLASDVVAHADDFRISLVPSFVAAVILGAGAYFSWTLSVKFYSAREL